MKSKRLENTIPLNALVLASVCLFFPGCSHVERAHDDACQQIASASQKLDSFFGEPRELEEYEKTRLLLSGGFIFFEEGRIKFSGRNQIKLALPSLRDRWGVLIGGQSEREEIDPEQIDDLEDGNYESFIRFFSKNSKIVEWDLDIGVKYNQDIKSFARLKGTYNNAVGIYPYRIIERVYWTNEIGFGEDTRFELDQQVCKQAIMREFMEYRWSEATPGVEIVGGIYLRTIISEGLGWSFEWVNYASTNPWEYRYFDLRTRLRKTVWRKWFELEVAPGVRFYHQDSINFTTSPSLEFRFSIQFDAEHLHEE